jgi:hypothetical protein
MKKIPPHVIAPATLYVVVIAACFATAALLRHCYP